MARLKRRSAPVDEGLRDRLRAHFEARLRTAPYREDLRAVIERLDAGEAVVLRWWQLRAVGVDVHNVDGCSHVVEADGSVGLSKNLH